MDYVVILIRLPESIRTWALVWQYRYREDRSGLNIPRNPLAWKRASLLIYQIRHFSLNWAIRGVRTSKRWILELCSVKPEKWRVLTRDPKATTFILNVSSSSDPFCMTQVRCLRGIYTHRYSQATRGEWLMYGALVFKWHWVWVFTL